MEHTIKTELGARLDTIKQRFKLNTSDLAKISGVTPQAIADILNGITDNPKISTLRNISTKLEINIDWLVNGNGEMTKTGDSKAVSYDKKEVDFSLMKYMRKVEFLQTVLLQNGIKVEMPNFKLGVPVSVLGNNYNYIFFDK